MNRTILWEDCSGRSVWDRLEKGKKIWVRKAVKKLSQLERSTFICWFFQQTNAWKGQKRYLWILMSWHFKWYRYGFRVTFSILSPYYPTPFSFLHFWAIWNLKSLKSHSFGVKALGQHSNDFNTIQVQLWNPWFASSDIADICSK